ncbi:MAG TPA: beta-galactosidase, partial [Clostridia bacterium]|nr:beta-galactosidase [Clostridia bacterium]
MKYKPPFYGSAYYPESWPKEKIKEDIALMKEMGMNVARIGEFAWSNMEPKEGKYDFSFMLHVVSELD